jgi:hypothetical protein
LEHVVSEQFNPVHEPLVHQGEAAERRLGQLGIDAERLGAALDAGDVAARQADRFSPVNGAGTLRWMETVRMLRQGLAADGWTPNDDRNSPRTIHPDGVRAVTPVSGTADTGLADGTPKTANPRGKASSRAVQINGQLEFSVTALLADMAAEKTSAIETWFLLYYRAQNDELRAELSLPVRISEKGVIDAWRERIILPTRTFGAELSVPRDAGGGDDVDFDIAAR